MTSFPNLPVASLPGYAEATRLGYSLSSYEAHGDSATYTWDGVYLTVRASGNASLEYIFGLVRCTISDFSFPNRNFYAFEEQIRRIQQAMG